MKLKTHLLKVKISRIPHAGKGLFTRQKIPKGQIITEYDGPLVHHKDADFKNPFYLYWSKKYVIDGSFSIARFINDGMWQSDCPFTNVEFYRWGSKIFIRATTDVTKGDELLLDYGDSYWNNRLV